MPGKLPRLQITTPIVDAQGKPTPAFQRFWQAAMEQIEARLGAVELAELDTAIAGANTAAAAANTAASNAQTTASNIASISALQTSFVGADCLILGLAATSEVDISSHTRLYGDGTSVNVSSGSVSGLTLGLIYFIYYDDAARAGGAETYHADTVAANAGYTAATPDRHFVGYVVMPATSMDPDVQGVANSQPIEVPQPAPVDFVIP